MKKVMGLVLGLVPVSAFGECVPVPDCASIGYTETSCDGGSLKCPFDTSKLYCPPCDSSFRYACSGENIKNPIGAACSNKYVTCECIAGATFSNGECICDTSCSVGNIYYSDGTCSSCRDENKTVVGVVVKNNELVMSANAAITLTYGPTRGNVPNIDFYSNENKIKDIQGKINTQAIIDYYGESGDPTLHAAFYCNEYAPTDDNSTKGNWYFPAAGEMYNYFCPNYEAINQTYVNVLQLTPLNTAFLTSTENDTTYAVAINFEGGANAADKGYVKRRVVCFLEI